jgi:hypothetical protein
MVGYVKGAVGVALVVSSAFSSLIASADVNPAPLDPAKVEGCVDLLRAAPAIFEGSSKFSSYDFSVIWLAGKDTSQAFTNCIKSTGAESEGEGHYDYLVMVEYDSAPGARIDFNPDDSLVYDDFPPVNFKDTKGVRYLYSDSYKRKYLLDLVEKRRYQLVRIPPAGSIESLGTWDGVYKDPINGCRNNYGDGCGSRYEINPNGGYSKLK